MKRLFFGNLADTHEALRGVAGALDVILTAEYRQNALNMAPLALPIELG